MTMKYVYGQLPPMYVNIHCACHRRISFRELRGITISLYKGQKQSNQLINEEKCETKNQRKGNYTCKYSQFTGFVSRLTRRVPLVEQELLTPPKHLRSHPFLVGFVLLDFSIMCMFCRSLFVLLYFIFWPLCCLFFFDIRILITSLLSSNSSYQLFIEV